MPLSRGSTSTARPPTPCPLAGPRFSLLLPWPAVCILVGTGAILLLAGSLKPIWLDELLEFFTDHQSARDIVSTQLHHPFSLDPPGFHLIAHAAMMVVGPTVLAQRVPSLFFFLLAQYAIFCIVRGLATPRAALVAALLPMLTFARHYGIEGRPYALVFAMSCTALLCWYRATTAAPDVRRWPALAGLVASLLVAIVSHFYGALLLIPLVGGELHRSLQRRRIDLPVTASLLVSTLGAALDIPFALAAHNFRAHYSPQLPPLASLALTWRTLFAVGHLVASAWLNLAVAALVVVLLAASFRARSPANPTAFWTAPALFLLLPFCGVALGSATHAFEPRYILATVTGMAVLLGMGLARPLSRNAVFVPVLTATVLIGLAIGARDIRLFLTQRSSFFSDFHRTLDLPEAWSDTPTPTGVPVYLHSVEAFLQTQYALPPESARNFVLVDSQPLELSWLGHDVSARTAEDLARTHPRFSILPYAAFRTLPGPLRVITNNHPDDAEEWFDSQLLRDGYRLSRIGPALTGTGSLAEPPPAQPGVD